MGMAGRHSWLGAVLGQCRHLRLRRHEERVMKAPFNLGDLVQIKNEHHLGKHVVDSCEWYIPGPGGAAPYWLCKCTEIREPTNWSKIPPGATGIVTYSGWSGNANHVEKVV